MPKFEKELLPSGKYLVTQSDGSRVLREFTPEFLSQVTDTTNKMIQSGLRIPAPYMHSEKAVPVTEQTVSNSYDNAGYWDKLVMKGKSLWGVIDAPGDEKDMTTPAGKLKNTIKEVSVCIQNAWKDGLGRDWGPCMLHAAPVLHPVVPGQSEFSLMNEAVALSTSGMIQQGSVNIGELSQALRDSVNIHLPPETPPEELVDVLLVSLRQYKLCNEDVQNDREVVEPVSVFMSIPEERQMPMTKESAEYIVNLGLLDPNTKEPVKLDDLKIADATPTEREEKLQSYSLALTKSYTDDKKTNLRSKVERLVSDGKTTKEYAEANIYPAIEEYRLSIGGDGNFQKASVEMLIENLESLPSPQGTAKKESPSLLSQGLPSGMNFHEGYQEGEGGELTPEEGDELVKEMLSMM